MAARRAMQIEDLFELKAVGRVALSPDGRRIVFEVKRADPQENKNFVQLMQVTTADGRLRAFTAAGKHSDSLPRWSPDGSHLAFISTRDKSAALWIMPIDGGEARRVTDRDGNVSDFDWSPDGKRLAYAYQPLSEREKLVRDDKAAEVQKGPVYKHITRLFHKLDGSGYWNGHRTHVHVVDADGGRPRQLTDGEYDDKEPRFSPDGKRVSFVSNRTANPDLLADQNDIYVVPAQGGKPVRVTRMPGQKEGHAWSPDGRTIAFLGSRHEPGLWWQHLTKLWTVPAGGGRPRPLTPRLDASHFNETMGDVAGATFLLEPPQWSADGSRLYFLTSTRGATHLVSCRATGGDVRDELTGRHNVMFAQRTRRDGPFAVTIGTSTNPGDVYLFEPAAHDGAPRRGQDRGRSAAAPAGESSVRRLTSLNAATLDKIDVIEPEEFELKSGPVKLQCWVIKPPGFKPNKRYPAIMEIHGGPQAQYGYGFFHEMQLLAARGFVVAFTNPRGSSGYGLEFRKSITGRWGTDDHKDVKRLGDWLFSRPYVDPKRVGVTGGSYGGYMTNWIVTHETRYAAACTQRCVSYMPSMFGTGDYGPQIVKEMGGPPWKDDRGLKKQSPLCFIDRCHTPLLIEHEDQDHRCEIEQAQQLFTSLKYLGREVELVIFEGESHGLSRGGRPHNRAERLRRIAGWFERWLKPRR